MKTKITLFVFGTSILLLGACSSSPKKVISSPQPDVVLSRIDDMSQRPDWVIESEPFTAHDGIVRSMGMTTVSGDSRVEAALRIAQNNAKAAIASSIEQRLEFVFQNAEEGVKFDASQARYIGSEASNLVSSSIHIGHHYWEKVSTSTDSGERVTQYKVFATVEMSEPDFKQAIKSAVHKAQGSVGLSVDFSKKVDAQWDKFTGVQPQQERRMPSADAGKE